MNFDNITNNNNELINERLARVQQDLAILYEVSNAMRTTLELDNILHIILTGVTSHSGLGFNRAILFLVNDKERCLEPKMAIGPESGEHAQKIWDYIEDANQDLYDLIKEENINYNINDTSLYKTIKDLKIPLKTDNNNLLARVYHEGKPLHISNQEINQYSNDVLLQKFSTNELVLVPLKAKDEIKGIIVADNLYTQKPISFEDLRIFIMLANQAGLAIENSQLFEMTIYKSRIDSVTNLWNHGFFQNKLLDELHRAQRTTTNVSLLMLDIDNFKNLNDTLGHQTGDHVLKVVADILKDSSRPIDSACRYGGEEFTMVLPRTDKKQAFAIAERIREIVATNNFSNLNIERDRKVTFSIGLATYPEDAETTEELIAKADQALYKAKHRGKNQTQLAE